jgi:hypothetical protein
MPRKQRTHLSPKDVALHASRWNRTELEEMRAIIEAMLESSTPQSPHTEVAPAEGNQRGKRGGSYIEEKRINGSGPYRYLRYWLSGKRKSVYLGKLEEILGDEL